MADKETEKVRRYSAVASIPMECLIKDLPISYDYEAHVIKELYRKFLDPISEELEFNKNIVIFSWDENHEDKCTDSIVYRKDLSVRTLTFCKDCKHYKQSAVADRKMCFRKDVDGVEVCYDFLPYDSCTYGERKENADIKAEPKHGHNLIGDTLFECKDESYCDRINPYNRVRVEDEDFCSWGEKNGNNY